jgi:F-type H+-transporting ATPase subunit b
MPHLHAAGTRAAILRAMLALVAALWLAPAILRAQPPAEPPPSTAQAAPHAAEAAAQPAAPGERAAGEAHATEAHGEGAAEGEGEHEESPWAVVARLVNFAILAGGLFYFLRSPLAGFLEQRGVSVRSDLKKAAELKKDAGAQIEQIEAKLKALPAEIEALKRRGAEEIKAEQARIHSQAEQERRRLLDQAKREIDTQLRIAERDLKRRAGELAVEVATERVQRTITERDHARLVERYVSQVRH